MNKIRIYELAKACNVTSKEIIGEAQKLDINVNHHWAFINKNEVELIIKSIQTIKEQQANNSVCFKKIASINKEKVSSEKNIKDIINEYIKKYFNQLETVEDLAQFINYINETIYKDSKKVEIKHLTYYAYHAKEKYKIFEIPKKSGGVREIYAPVKGLKNILKTLNIIFQALYKPKIVAHGFIRKKSVITNAKIHVKKKYIYNIDLENFFPNIHQARIWKMFQYPPFNLRGEKIKLANLLANLVCYQYEKEEKKKNFLPQGAPTSPILSNIICQRLDKKLLKLAKEYNVKYTRYADDITFSSDHNVYQKDSEFLRKLFSIIESENFKINSEKIRLQKRGYRQEVTGLIVNEKINVSRRYIKNLRALIHLVEKYENKKAQEIFSQKNGEKNLKQVIFGKLNYLKMVKGDEDSTYKTLYKKAINAYKVNIDSKNIDDQKTDLQNKKKNKNNKEKKHDPKEIVKILSKFTMPGALKATTHTSEEYYEFGGYENFMKSLKEEWKKIDKKLKVLSNRLHGKIWAFLFDEKLGIEEGENGKRNKKTWGEHHIAFGWSSPELKEWCLNDSEDPRGNDPFEYQLEEKYRTKVDGKSIETFFDVCNIFKNEIEARTEVLYKIFLNMKKTLKTSRNDFELTIDKNIKGVVFYIDVHWLKSGIKVIFDEIKTRKEFNSIEVKLKEDKKEYIEISIIQEGSEPNKKSEKLASRIEEGKGGISEIYERFFSLCDWSVEAKCLDGNYRINYLRDEKTKEIEELDYEPKGFTHILRFYK